MDYKKIFHIASLLISSPAKAWEEIRAQGRGDVTFNYVYPLIGLAALSVFIGALIDRGWDGPDGYQYAMARCCTVVVTFFGGFFLSAYIINAICKRFYNMADDMPLCYKLAGYSLTVPMLLQVVTGLLPDFYIIAVALQFYIIYIVWAGSNVLMQVQENNRLSFTIVVSVILMVCPALLGRLFDVLEASM